MRLIYEPASEPLHISANEGQGKAILQLHPSSVPFRGWLVFKAHRLCVSLNSRLERLERNKEEEEPESLKPQLQTHTAGERDLRIEEYARPGCPSTQKSIRQLSATFEANGPSTLEPFPEALLLLLYYSRA